MSRILFTVTSIVLLTTGCSLAPAANAPFDAVADAEAREAMVKKNHALIESITSRLSERDLAAAVASERVALLEQRVSQLRARCAQLSSRDCAQYGPHLEWLTQVYTTTTLAIGVLRNDSRDFDEDKAEVLLWMKVFAKEIDSLERRVDRIAPTRILLTQRSIK